MCAIVEYQPASFFSSAFCTATFIAVKTLSSLCTVAFHDASVTGENVSLLSPLKASGFTLLNLSRICLFQKIRCVVSCAIEWLLLLSFQLACSAVKPATAVVGGTNQSFTLCVVLSCSSKIDFKVDTVSCCARTLQAIKPSNKLKQYFMRKCLK